MLLATCCDDGDSVWCNFFLIADGHLKTMLSFPIYDNSPLVFEGNFMLLYIK